jgi:pyridoxine/pyridoxamine 5'-phosphate oxidase
MKQKNLDIYGHEALPWSRALEQLEANADANWFLATARPDGRPHVAGIGALWLDGKIYVVTGPRTRKGRNLAANPHCVLSVALNGLDLVIEGSAVKVTDETTLRRLAKRYADQGWPAKVSDGALTAEYSAPSAGPPPWDLYVVMPEKAFGVAGAEPHGATRWTFDGK